MSTKTKSKKSKKQSIAQRAGVYRAALTRKGVKTMTDYKGQEVPVAYVPAMDMVKHYITEEIIEEAKELQQRLAEFKAKCQAQGDDLYERLMEENEIRETSVGGFTLTNFDKSKKVEFKMGTIETVLEEEIAIAKKFKDKFVEEITESVPDKETQSIILEMMNMAFERSNGKIDPRRRSELNKYRERVTNKNFRKFLDHYNKAFDLNHTKRFEMFKERNNQGEYESILLTYSSLEPAETTETE